MKYDIMSHDANAFISDEEVRETIEWAEGQKTNLEAVRAVIEKSKSAKGLTHKEAALLLLCEDADCVKEIKAVAHELKLRFYGNRIVMFAPLYLSNYCVNGCVYCPYHATGTIARKKLTQEEIRAETIALCDMGHKRLALESGEDKENCPIDYILDSIHTVYNTKSKNGSIRRVNVNIAATTVSEYTMLRDAGIGTYILFQETYDKARYEALHKYGPKANYEWHTEAMDRAMTGGINDVGCGVLWGLSDYRYDFVALLMHAEHLEAVYNCGPHTVSVPRIRSAEGINAASFANGITDDTLEKIVACVRLAMPYTGMIVSTRESAEMRRRVLPIGISQMSGGSMTSVGGYANVKDLQAEVTERDDGTEQFSVNDRRTLDEVLAELIKDGYTPSFCTACYREGRTGERFMSLVKSSQIGNCCLPNALVTLSEYLCDYASDTTKQAGWSLIEKELETIPNEKVRSVAKGYIERVKVGERDMRF